MSQFRPLIGPYNSANVTRREVLTIPDECQARGRSRSAETVGFCRNSGQGPAAPTKSQNQQRVKPPRIEQPSTAANKDPNISDTAMLAEPAIDAFSLVFILSSASSPMENPPDLAPDPTEIRDPQPFSCEVPFWETMLKSCTCSCPWGNHRGWLHISTSSHKYSD